MSGILNERCVEGGYASERCAEEYASEGCAEEYASASKHESPGNYSPCM